MALAQGSMELLNAQECDTTNDDNSNQAGNLIINIIKELIALKKLFNLGH